MVGRRAAAIAALAIVGATLGTIATAGPVRAASKGNDTVNASPAPGSSLNSAGGYYQLHATPGATISQQVRITNPNNHAVTVHVEGVDGFTSDATGASYGTPGEAPRRDGRWILVSTPELTLQPSESRDIEFSVHVPADATPGQHLAGISVSVPPSTPSTTVATGGASFQITLVGQRVIAVEVDVPGATAPKLVVSGITPKATPDGVQLRIHMANTGNAFTKGSAVVRVPDTRFQHSYTIDTFVSHTEINFPVKWTHDVVPGSHAVSVKLSYGDGRIATWNGTVDIVGAVRSQLEQDLRNNRPVPSHSNGAEILIIAGLAFAIACALAAFLLRRRETRRVPARIAAG